jgi:hypothetical protein
MRTASQTGELQRKQSAQSGRWRAFFTKNKGSQAPLMFETLK